MFFSDRLFFGFIKTWTSVGHLGPAALLTQEVGVEVGHPPRPFVGEAPHQLPVAHVVELLPGLLRFTAVLKERHRLVEQRDSRD